MKKTFSLLCLKNTNERWESVSEQLLSLPGNYVYCHSEHEVPDRARIQEMFGGALRDADLIVPAEHTQFPAEEVLEEKQLAPLHVILERFRCSPLVNGKLIKKSFLQDCLKKNFYDWIHSPCPDLFLMLGASARACIARTGYVHDLESFQWFSEQYKKASGWLSALPDLPEEKKYIFRCRILQYEDYLIDCADKLNLSGEEKFQYFDPLSIIHNAVTENPEKLRELNLSRTEFQNKPVRCLAVFCSALRSGGAERCASLLLKYFAALPDLKIFLFQSKKNEPGDYPCPETVEVTILPKDFYERQIQLPKLLQEKRVDTCLFFDHFLTDFYFDILTARKLGIRTVAMEHTTFSFPIFAGDLELLPLRQIVYPVTDVVTCLSRTDEYLWMTQGVRARYMPNPLTFDPELRAPFTERKEKTLIFIARMNPGKGVLDAVRVAELVRKKHPDVKLYMLGSFTDPVFEQEIKDYVKNHALTENVEFTGFTKVENYISRASVHLMPSSVEGWCLALMEAKFFGLPTVSYDMPYLETLKDEYGSITVPQQDYRAMAEKVSELFDDFRKLNDLAGKAYNSLHHFGNQIVYARWNALFQWLETGTEPAELSVPDWSEEEKRTMLQIQNKEIISAAAAVNLPFCRNKILNLELSSLRNKNILFNSFLRMYFNLHQKIEDGSSLLTGLTFLFRIIWRMKRIYRFFKPWQDKEQKL